MTIKYELLLPYPHMLYEEGIVFVWETAAMTFPGGFTDGGKTAKQKDLKSYLNHFYLYAKKKALNGLKRVHILPVNSSGCFQP